MLKYKLRAFGKKYYWKMRSEIGPVVRLDSPKLLLLSAPIELISGWSVAPLGFSLKTVKLNGRSLDFHLFARPDISLVHAPKYTTGFSSVLDLITQEESLPLGSLLEFDFENGEGRHRASKMKLSISPDLEQKIKQSKIAKAEKSSWIRKHWSCPECQDKDASLVFNEHEKTISCKKCNAKYYQEAKSLNLITPEMVQSFQLTPTGNISANHYDEVALDIIESVRRAGGKVLDCGAGLRRTSEAVVINAEIVDYPSTDVLAVGQRLPFQDESFDAVLSIAVLEHVSDPFLCAREMVRVLKPGGKIYCAVPFLQPEHGYPDHYFNMTRSGLAELFKNSLTMEKQFVHKSCLPIWTLTRILSVYRENLPPRTRKRFDAMSVIEFMSQSEIAWLDDEIVKDLSDRGIWEIASSTCAIMSKPL